MAVGIDEAIVLDPAVLNHAQERIRDTYDVHDYLEEKPEALAKWAAHLLQLTTGKQLFRKLMRQPAYE